MSDLLGILGWVAASILTFLVVTLAFLLLANFGSSTEDVRIDPGSSVSTTGSRLEMTLDESEIEALSASPDQRFTVTLTNGGDQPLRDINVLAEVSSEDTSLPDTSFSTQTLPELAAGRAEEVVLEVDLSQAQGDREYPAPEPPRSIVEIRATTPDGISAVTTVILRLT